MTPEEAIAKLERRAQAHRQRVEVIRWEIRQRKGTKGTWFRLRYLLAMSARAFAISEDDAAALIAEGFSPALVGEELHPRKVYLVVPQARVLALGPRHELRVKLSAELLAEPRLALVPF